MEKVHKPAMIRSAPRKRSYGMIETEMTQKRKANDLRHLQPPRLDAAKPGVFHTTPPVGFFRGQGRKQILSTALSCRWQVSCERPDSLGRWPAPKDFK
jgi:hypothetical protein